MQKINIEEKFDLITEYWKPKVVGELNNQQIRLVKIKGEFVFHKHDKEDEFFLVIKGLLKMEFEDRYVILKEGEFIIIPRGVKHRPVADQETHLLLFEPDSVLNTGNVINEFTVDSPEKI
ncbi:MAG: cupin domain-containing protein [Bacteroidales bacterium]|nr:MAG: cupin domain-containing protein [Bacteroidales bacterium]